MHILIQIVLLAIGFACLVKGADVFVGGSSSLARNFNVPGLIIGLTRLARIFLIFCVFLEFARSFIHCR